MKGFLHASLCLAGRLPCDFYSHEMRPGAAAVPKMRKLQERIEFSLPVNEFLKPQGHEASGFPLFFHHSKLDATFVQCLALSIGILPGIASVATKMDLVQGRALQLLSRNLHWNTWQGAAPAALYPFVAAGSAQRGIIMLISPAGICPQLCSYLVNPAKDASHPC